MNTFNKYQFLADLQSELLDAVATNQIQSEDQVWDWIHQSIDNAVIYNADCFAILSELNYTDWSDSEFGPVTNVSIAAYSAIYELVNDEFDLSAVNGAIAALED
jgi:3-dehydroquinate dehydratase